MFFFIFYGLFIMINLMLEYLYLLWLFIIILFGQPAPRGPFKLKNTKLLKGFRGDHVRALLSIKVESNARRIKIKNKRHAIFYVVLG